MTLRSVSLFGGRLMTKSGVHLCPVYDGSVEPIILSDAYWTGVLLSASFS